MTGRDAADFGARLKPHPDVVARRVEDEIVAVQLGRNHVYALNRTGARLWELIVEGCSPAQAIERMLGEFDVPEAELRAEVGTFLELLLREELVSTDEG